MEVVKLHISGVKTNVPPSLELKADSKQDNLSFKDFLLDAIYAVNKLQLEAEQKQQLLATGQINNLHEVTIASEKADTVQIRNKIIEAYNEVMRMQI
jgi:flagellar hook-basal body complex protein FliE